MGRHRGPDRRAVMGGAGALGVLAVIPAIAQTAAPPGLRLSGVRVDARPLAAKGAPGAAELIQRILPDKLALVFADVMETGRAAPVLVARLDQIYLSNYADVTPTGRSTQALDFMDGVGFVMSGGQVQSSTPLHVVLPASYSGTWYLPNIDARRIDSICYQFAYWLRREMQV